jgi:hypothetical protein
MIKKFTLIMLFLFMLGIAAFSQTASLDNIIASPGENKPVALNVSGFTGIGSLTFNIEFDPTVMSYTGFSLPAGSPGGFNVYASGSTLNIVGTWPSNASFLDGKMLDLKFTYNGMTEGSLSFLGSSLVTQGVTPISPVYTNGSVSMAVIPATAILASITASTGGEANVDLSFNAISGNVGAITQKIQYDPTKLAFANVTGTGFFATGVNASANSSIGVITLTWAKTGGANINSSTINLKFVFNGNTSTPLDFIGGCVVSNSVGDNINIYYDNGEVSPSPFTATAVLGSVSTAIQGTIVEIPLTLTGFTSGVSGGTQSFTLNLPYSTGKLDYVGLKNSVSGLTVSAASGTLNLAWYDASGPNINGDFATLKFVYKGIGAASVAFGSNCVFNTNTGGTISTVQVGYTNSTVTPANASATATLGFVAGTSGTNVLVPLSFAGLPSMGALTLAVTYDVDKLSFVNALNNVQNANVYQTSDNVIHIAWSSTSGIDINSKFLDLQFEYHSGGGVASAAVDFADGCEFSSLTPVAIIPVNFVNGGVNFIFTVSGTLLYDNHPPYSSTLAGFTVNLRDASNVIVGTDVTDGSGNYSISVPNGVYTIEGVAPIDPLDAPWFASELSHDIIFYYANGFNYIDDETSLKVQAMDVNLDSYPLEDDADLVFYRANGYYYPEFSAPDWLFEIPSITVSNADLTGQTFFGICAGDVAGEGPIF